MQFSISFFINSILLGIGLAMDAFSVSIANGLNEPKMKAGKVCGVAGTYAFFQFAMPMIGWVCVHTVVVFFTAAQKFIPWIALILLLYIGGKMVIESCISFHKARKCKQCNNCDCENRKFQFNEDTKKQILTECADKGVEPEKKSLSFITLMVQGIATSIDALSVGFTIAEYNWLLALIASIIIAAETFVICVAGLKIGKKAGEKLSEKATLVGGIILIAIGVEIFVKGIFFGG